jgi:hypothetical protein
MNDIRPASSYGRTALEAEAVTDLFAGTNGYARIPGTGVAVRAMHDGRLAYKFRALYRRRTPSQAELIDLQVRAHQAADAASAFLRSPRARKRIVQP